MLKWPLPLCHTCHCEQDDSRRPKAIAQAFNQNAENEIQVPGHWAPKVRGFPTYSSEPNQPLLGVPIREGCLWHLSTQDRFEPVNFALYVNGFAFSTQDGKETWVSLSPFSLVRNCRFQSGACSQLKSFKVSLLDHDPCCYFAVRSICEREAEEERSEWVLGISHTILLITDSILPPFSITCDPQLSVSLTHRRLVAGYLIHRDDASSISVLFCELHAHCGETARLLLYENELCINPLMDIIITDSSVCCDIVGINCSCFVIDCHHFASQTPSERKLWLRALSNVKVKIQNRAPEPNEEELQYYRDSIREHIQAIEATLEPRISSDPLLARCSRKSLHTVGDGDLEPPAAPSPDDLESRASSTHVSL